MSDFLQPNTPQPGKADSFFEAGSFFEGLDEPQSDNIEEQGLFDYDSHISLFSTGREYLGSIQKRDGEFGIEVFDVFDANGVLLGTFEDVDDAINALPDGQDARIGSNGGNPSTKTNGSRPAPNSLREEVGDAIQANKKPPLPQIEITRFTKHGGPLTKSISLGADGTLKKDDSACKMVHGTAERVVIADVAALAALIQDLTPSQAIALGSLRADLLDEVEVTTKNSLNGAVRPDIIARTNSNIIYHGPAYALLDFDDKGVPPAVVAEINRVGGLIRTLLTVLPALKGTAHVARHSTSAGLSRIDTSEALPGSNGIHIYLAVKDGTDIPRFLKALHDRCWLAGFGWMMVSVSGAALERSIIDRAVGGPERLVFEGGPVLAPPLQQDKESRRPRAFEGVLLDTGTVCPELTISERAQLDKLKAKERERLAPAIAKAREAFVETQARKLVARTGMPEQAARQVIKRQCEGILRPDIILPFDNPELAGKTVRDVLANPELFEGETLADPLEGVGYGICKAMILRGTDGTPWIHSYAHGRSTYELKHDAGSVRKVVEEVAKEDVVATFVRLVVAADLNAIEQAELRQLVANLSGVGVRVIDAVLKEALLEQARQDTRQKQARRLSERQDPRPQVRSPSPDEQWIPQMSELNDVIGKVVAACPPVRNIDDDATRVRKMPVPNMHAFTPGCVNAEPEETTEDKLPPPEQWVLLKMSEMEVAEMIERHIDHYTEDEEGNRRSVHYPTPFVRHYMKRDDDALPTVVAVATAPIVLADGELLAPEGLDRLRGIQFIIPDELRAVIPAAADCTPEHIKQAMEFLCDQWLVDVATDYNGKYIIIADALTLIERSLLPDRPCFFYTAGRRGGGKTTTLTMTIMTVTGVRPAAAAWSSNEEERRKALLSYFMAGVPYIIWDNIPRGMQISCPHIEKSCTAAYYSDRKLGVSELVCTAASTIHHFTGNNIGAKGDLASRKLEVRINVDRADPENREFKHPDPVGWSDEHRAEILGALYTLLLGNPQLKTPRETPGKTRFKMWWRLVGSAVEHAARVWGRELDFQKLFLEQEEDEEESATLADVLDIILARHQGEFVAQDIATLVNNNRVDVDDEAKGNRKLLRDFLLPGTPEDHFFSVKSVGRLLKKHLDNPVMSDRGVTLVLRKRVGRAKENIYHIDGAEAQFDRGTEDTLDDQGGGAEATPAPRRRDHRPQK